MSALFSTYTLATASDPLVLPNRIIIAPMCQYSARDGLANDWHLMHWANLLNGGAGMLIIEATAVTPRGRITPQCLGLWDDATADALGSHLHRARRLAPQVPVCIQLAHAGRKGSSAAPWQGGQLLGANEDGWLTQAPSALPHLPEESAPEALSLEELAHIRDSFVQAAIRAQDIGIEAIELHAAHGYLLHQFLSPLANQRQDQYGGSFDNRIRFPLEIFEAIRHVYRGSLGIRLSATDWVDGGWTPEETADLSLRIKQAGGNFLHISTAGVSPLQKIPVGPLYQVPFARMVKQKTGLPTIAVGLITQAQQANALIEQGDADLVALARAFLYNPRWGWQAAAELGATVQASPQYWRCLPREAQSIFGAVRIGMR
jgi:2,4-dienoyl-CoA reductase-like NADH-dependent reductase (Old Yellow Enzyme family)